MFKLLYLHLFKFKFLELVYNLNLLLFINYLKKLLDIYFMLKFEVKDLLNFEFQLKSLTDILEIDERDSDKKGIKHVYVRLRFS